MTLPCDQPAFSASFDKLRTKPGAQMVAYTLQQGAAAARAWTCDFTAEYVRINGEYRT